MHFTKYMLEFIVLVILFFAAVHIYSQYNQTSYAVKMPVVEERFNSNELIPPEKMIVYQGNAIPDLEADATQVEYDTHESLPNVDGNADSPRSMFMMAFNKCDPSCCPSTYSCSGGCVCMTKDQYNFVGSRGTNNKQGCSI